VPSIAKVDSGKPLTQDASPAQSRRKLFTVVRKQVMIHWGGESGLGYNAYLDADGNNPAIYCPVDTGFGPPARFYAKDWVIYVDATVTDGVNRFDMENNKADALPPQWKSHDSGHTVEIVNEQNRVVFQAVYKNDMDISVSGIFIIRGDLIAVLNDGGMTALVSTEDAKKVNIPPIFDYGQ